jgi:protein-S-isoprenylcysteine O-methyltransferase Ste14
MSSGPAGMAVNLLLIFARACPLLLVALHAIFEARASIRYTGIVSAKPSGAGDYSLLWLVSSVSFVLYALFASYAAFSIDDVPAKLAVQIAIGAALVAAGISLRVAAIHTLENAFNRPPWKEPKVQLSSDGPFAWMRHPSELGLAFICLGLASASDSRAVLSVFVLILLPLALLRIRLEEIWLGKSGLLRDPAEGPPA